MIARFFPGAREELAAIDEEIVRGGAGPRPPARRTASRTSTSAPAGQLYELMAGHDRFVADLRPLMEPGLAARGLRLGICCHPYDLCHGADRAGGRASSSPTPRARPSTRPSTSTTDVAWVGYANAARPRADRAAPPGGPPQARPAPRGAVSAAPLPDVQAFLRELAHLADHPEPAARALFDRDRDDRA